MSCSHTTSNICYAKNVTMVFDVMIGNLLEHLKNGDEDGYHSVIADIREAHDVQFVDENGESMVLEAYYAIVTDLILEDDWVRARKVMQAATNLASVIYHDGNSISNLSDELEIDKIERIRLYLSAVERIRTKSGLVADVADRIPCSCLDAKRSMSLRLPTTVCCFECFNDQPRETISLCSRCRLATYCSAACQKKNWNKEHKGKCNKYRRFLLEEHAPIIVCRSIAEGTP